MLAFGVVAAEPLESAIGLLARGPEDQNRRQKEDRSDQLGGPCRLERAENSLQANGNADCTR